MTIGIQGKLAKYARKVKTSSSNKVVSPEDVLLKAGIVYEEVYLHDLSVGMFTRFNRHQEVNWCWRKKDGKWVLQNIPFVIEWSYADIVSLVDCLKDTIRSGGIVLGAFSGEFIVGFASVENDPFGSDLEYIQLSNLHVSYEHRGKGIGKALFKLTCKAAKSMNAKKLYISAHSSEETQAFCKSIKCREAAFYHARLAMARPYDRQLEYTL